MKPKKNCSADKIGIHCYPLLAWFLQIKIHFSLILPWLSQFLQHRQIFPGVKKKKQKKTALSLVYSLCPSQQQVINMSFQPSVTGSDTLDKQQANPDLGEQCNSTLHHLEALGLVPRIYDCPLRFFWTNSAFSQRTWNTYLLACASLPCMGKSYFFQYLNPRVITTERILNLSIF